MKSLRLRLLAQTLPCLLAVPGMALAQAGPPTRAEAEAALAAPGPATAAYSAPQIDQIVAPIALYPDQLLSQVLMAATYPQQIADAAQWLQDPNNAALHGDALAAALQPLPWDPSVKALVAFPQVVMMLSEHIDWTQTLGVAFATQQSLVMVQIQYLRRLAMRGDRLRHLSHLVFRNEDGVIVVLPANANEIYVPIYNPVVVYGSYWPAPDYPPVYVTPPPGFVGATIAPGLEVSVGYAVVASLWGWGHPDWRDHRIAIDRTAYTRITRTAVVGPSGAWRHRGPVALAAANAARTPPPGAAAMPRGTVAPGRAAAVAALPQRAAREPAAIRPALHQEAAAHPPAPPPHPAPREAAGAHPASHEATAAHPPAPAPQPAPREAAGAHPPALPPHPAPREAAGAHPPTPPQHPAPREATVAHPPALPPHPAPRAATAAHPPPHPVPRPAEHAAVRPPPAAPHPAAHPAPAPREAAAAHPPAPAAKPPEKKE